MEKCTAPQATHALAAASVCWMITPLSTTSSELSTMICHLASTALISNHLNLTMITEAPCMDTTLPLKINHRSKKSSNNKIMIKVKVSNLNSKNSNDTILGRN